MEIETIRTDGGRKPSRLRKQGRFAHAPTAVDQQAWAAGRQHDLAFELSEHTHAWDEGLLQFDRPDHRREQLRRRFLAGDALDLDQLTLSDQPAIGRRRCGIPWPAAPGNPATRPRKFSISLTSSVA